MLPTNAPADPALQTNVTRDAESPTMKLDWRVPVVALLTILLLAAVAKTLGYYARLRTDSWMTYVAPDTVSTTVILAGMRGDSLERTRFEQQFRSASRAAKLHGEIMGQFYRAHFIHVSMATICAVLAASLLVFVSVKGWSQSDPRLLAALVVVAGGTAIFTGLSAVYQQARNVSDSKALYQQAMALRERMLTFAATNDRHKNVVPLGDTTVAVMLRSVDGDLAKVTTVPIGFDESKVPVGGGLDVMQKAAGGH